MATFMKGFAIVTVIILALSVLSMATGAGSWAWRYFTAEIRGTVDAEEQIQSGSNRVQEYEKFFDRCASAQTLQATLDAQRSALDTTESQKERERINSTIVGMQAQLNRYVNQYNADARKDYTSGQFRSSDLPYQLNANQPINCN